MFLRSVDLHHHRLHWLQPLTWEDKTNVKSAYSPQREPPRLSHPQATLKRECEV